LELHRFFEGIRMMPEAVRQVGRLHIEERTYQRIKALFQRDKKKFYTTVLRQPDFRICFLYYFSRMGCETYERYQEDGIGERIYWDTFYDLTLWCENCFREYGAYGIDQYDWFFRHIECRLFRLGRLEFERMESEWALKYGRTEIKKGDTVINVHIPQGERLELAAVRASCEQAFSFWGKQYPYICHSWLLYPELSRVLGKESNILGFQKLFRIVQVDFAEREAEWRIYGKIQDDLELYQEATSLQKKAKEYLRDGGALGNGLGILDFSAG